MKKTEVLYNNIPPSKLRKGKDPFIESNCCPFCKSIFSLWAKSALLNRFQAIRVKNLENFDRRNKECANILYASHNCWWDGVIGYLLCNEILKTDMRMMIEELVRFPILSRVGGFSVDKKSAKASIKSLEYSSELLKNPDISLWLFPQGIIKPPDFRPISFSTGISYLSEKVEKVNLIPIAIKYTFLRYGMPEVLIEVGKPIFVGNNIIDRKKFTAHLEQDYTQLLDKQALEISKGQLYEYETIFRKKDGILKKLENLIKSK